MRVLFLNNGPRKMAIGLGGLLVLFFLVKSCWPSGLVVPNAQDVVNDALLNLESAHSYRYQLTAISIIGGEETVLTQVDGVFNRPDRFYLKGETLSTPLEAYILGDEYYVRDPQDQWMHLSVGPAMVQETILFAQSPLQDLHRLHSLTISEVKVERQPFFVVEGKLVNVTNPLWQAFWQDFSVGMWIDKGERKVRRLDVFGRAPGTDDRLVISMELTDYDANLPINLPPELLN